MVQFYDLSIKLEALEDFLKTSMGLREACYKILEQKIIARAATARNLTVTPEEINNVANYVLEQADKGWQ